MFLLLTFVYALCVFTVQSRVVMIQDTPITAEGISLKISLKEDDSTGRKMASIKLVMEDGADVAVPEPAPAPTLYPPHMLGELIPDVESRFGTRDGKCPIGWVRRGILCTPK